MISRSLVETRKEKKHDVKGLRLQENSEDSQAALCNARPGRTAVEEGSGKV